MFTFLARFNYAVEDEYPVVSRAYTTLVQAESAQAALDKLHEEDDRITNVRLTSVDGTPVVFPPRAPLTSAEIPF